MLSLRLSIFLDISLTYLMNRRFLSVLVFALLVAAAASVLVYHFVLTNVEAASRRPQSLHKLLVAAHTLEVGAMIQDADLRLVNFSATLPASSHQRQTAGHWTRRDRNDLRR